MRAFLFAFCLSATVLGCTSNSVTDADWAAYKLTYGKQYASTTAESNARYYYAVNKQKIATHNARFDKALESYQLAVNQYSDLRFLEFAALFPATTEIPTNGVAYSVPTTAPPASFSYAELGYSSPVLDQGQVCNSGWAYAAATAIQIYNAVINADLSSVSLSAQNFIDCAGASKACVNQVSQVAFDYLTRYLQRVHPVTTYPNTPLIGQKACLLPTNQVGATSLAAYSNLANGNDANLRSVLNYVAPVVIKFNPGSFEFMHYSNGIFTQPAPTQTAAHYMTVVGYGTSGAKDFWIVQNSFGLTWGEVGFIRIERNTAKPITNAAIFPSL